MKWQPLNTSLIAAKYKALQYAYLLTHEGVSILINSLSRHCTQIIPLTAQSSRYVPPQIYGAMSVRRVHKFPVSGGT